MATESQPATEIEEGNLKAASRTSNIKGLFSNGRTRMFIVLVGIVLILMVAFGYHSATSKSDSKIATASISTPPTINSIPGSSDSKDYNKKVTDQNLVLANQANQQGKTFLPTLTNNSSLTNKDPLNLDQPSIPASPNQPIPAQPSSNQMPQESPQNQQQIQDEKQAQQTAQKNVDEQIQYYMGYWKNGTDLGSQEFVYNGQKLKESAPSTSQNASTSSATNKGSNLINSATSGPVLIRAGTIVPAILLTPLNSDSPGPVLAQITSGPFSGARLIGSFSRVNDHIIVAFSRLSMTSEPKTFTINAYAVNQNLQTGLATDVNHHYLSNYGLLAASALIQGYGQAVSTSNATVTTGPFGSTTSYGSPSNKQIVGMALGQVGTEVGSQLAASAIKPTTVKVEGSPLSSGVPIGVLFMSDF